MRLAIGWICLVLAGLIAGPAQAGNETITVNGTKRTYIVEVPSRRPAPLVIVLHGNTQQGVDMTTRTSWPALARREQLTIVYPDGLNKAWADFRSDSKRAGFTPPPGTDDVGFLTALIDKLVAAGTADPKRIYLTGLSNGGAMTMTMVCARADLFAAAASVIFSLTDLADTVCHPSRPVPMLLMNGTDDPLIPYEGGKGSSDLAAGGFWSTEKTFAFWKRINGCDPDPIKAVDLPDRDHADGSTVSRLDAHCPAGRDVVLYRINGGGHRFPSFMSDARMPRLLNGMLGPQNHDIDGAEVVWAFFRKFSRP
jgi:polyhydroxybutyrate depolymerase